MEAKSANHSPFMQQGTRYKTTGALFPPVREVPKLYGVLLMEAEACQSWLTNWSFYEGNAKAKSIHRCLSKAFHHDLTETGISVVFWSKW